MSRSSNLFIRRQAFMKDRLRILNLEKLLRLRCSICLFPPGTTTFNESMNSFEWRTSFWEACERRFIWRPRNSSKCASRPRDRARPQKPAEPDLVLPRRISNRQDDIGNCPGRDPNGAGGVRFGHNGREPNGDGNWTNGPGPKPFQIHQPNNGLHACSMAGHRFRSGVPAPAWWPGK